MHLPEELYIYILSFLHPMYIQYRITPNTRCICHTQCSDFTRKCKQKGRILCIIHQKMPFYRIVSSFLPKGYNYAPKVWKHSILLGI